MKPADGKILILLPFWKGDKAQAMLLARLLADLEPGYSGLADFAFVARRDCKHDNATVGYVSKKFNTFTCISQRQEVGWPQGCNGTFFGSIDWALRGISSGKLPKYKALFNCAADTCPLMSGGLKFLSDVWDALKVNIAGAMVPGNRQGPAGFHINGDCTLISADTGYLFWLAKQAGNTIRCGGGWDWILAPQFEGKGWADIVGVKSHWQRATFFPEEWDGYCAGGVRWLHGIKDNSLLTLARKKLL